MPPKKKLKLPSQGASTPSRTENPQLTPTAGQPVQPEAPSKPGTEYDSIVADPWTDEQETSLLKGIIKWKPVGSSRSIHLMLLFYYAF